MCSAEKALYFPGTDPAGVGTVEVDVPAVVVDIIMAVAVPPMTLLTTVVVIVVGLVHGGVEVEVVVLTFATGASFREVKQRADLCFARLSKLFGVACTRLHKAAMAMSTWLREYIVKMAFILKVVIDVAALLDHVIPYIYT